MASGPPTTFRRQASPNECLYLHFQDAFDSVAMQFVIEGIGTLDRELFTQAVAVATRASPGAGCVYRDGEWVDDGVLPPVTFLVGEAFPTADMQALGLLHHKIPVRENPAAEIFAFDQGDARLLIRIFHGVMDGKGAFIWLENIFRALRGEPLVEAIAALTDLDLLRLLQASKHHVPVSFQYRALTRASGTREGVAHTVHWQRLRLLGHYPSVLPKVAAALANHLGDPGSKFLIPVDMRRHRREALATGNLTMPIFLEASRGEPWQEVSGRLLFSLKNAAELNLGGADFAWLKAVPSLMVGWVLRALIAYQRWSRRFLVSGILSHLGRIPLAAWEAPGFKPTGFFSLPVQQPTAPLTVVITEAGPYTEVLIASYRDWFSEGECQALLAHIQRFVVEAS